MAPAYGIKTSELEASQYLMAAEQASGIDRQAAVSNANSVLTILAACYTEEAKGYKVRANAVLSANGSVS